MGFNLAPAMWTSSSSKMPQVTLVQYMARLGAKGFMQAEGVDYNKVSTV